MKLKGANLLELSLSLAFALVVFAITLQLVQESTDRINKGFSFQTFQQTAFTTLLNIQHQNHWGWGPLAPINTILNTNLPPETSITATHYIFSNNQWVTSTNDSDATHIQIENPTFNKKLSVFIVSSASKKNLMGGLATIKLALLEYYRINQFYPPTHQLNYLTQSHILNDLPNNPYTIQDLNATTNKNMTDWHYENNNGQITLFAYTHPQIKLTL
jgi:hypothetical protein